MELLALIKKFYNNYNYLSNPNNVNYLNFLNQNNYMTMNCSLPNSNYFTSAKKCRRESCIMDLTSAKKEFASAIFKIFYFSKYSIEKSVVKRLPPF